MAVKTDIDDKYLDPTFKKFGKKVYTYEYIEQLRAENLDLKVKGRPIYNLVPQSGFQEKVCQADADLLIIGGKKGGGKVMPNETPIVTPFGMRKNGDLKIGQIISNPVTGGMERVIDIYEHPNHDFYEVFFDDGSSCECGLEHLWLVRQTGYTHKRRQMYGCPVDDDYRVWTFGMIKRWLDEQNEKGKHRNKDSKKYLVIPLCEPVKFTKSGNSMRKNDIDPYVIGALIGDGTVTDIAAYDAYLTTADIEIAEEFAKAGIDISNCYQKEKTAAKTYRIKNDKVREALELTKLKGCTSINKFIPTCYKWGTVEERFALIQGLMDTDGYIDERGHLAYTTISKTLAEDVRFVIESLGGTAKISRKKAGYKDDNGEYVECNDAYELYIKIKESHRLFRLSRKKERSKAFNNGVSEVCRRIVGYRHVGRKDGRCIRVDSRDSLYMANNFIVTHNSFIALFKAFYYMYNSDVSMYAFRKTEDDILRGPWKASKYVFKGFATPRRSSFEWNFLDGKGASFKMEHLQDLGKISDRFRGAEMAYMDIEELPEHTKENVDIIFDCLSVNRNTVGAKSQVVATCNPVGKGNKLRHFLDWYIDPDTNTVIPERDGCKRYMFNYGSDLSEIAWGNSWQEVYEHPKAKEKIDILLDGKDDLSPEDLILTVMFIEGDYANNKILQVSDKRYVSRLASKGGAAVVNDMRGVWADIDSGTSLLSLNDMYSFFGNSERRDGIMRASADVALTGDYLVIYAFDGHHVCDIEAYQGVMSDDVIPFIERFLQKNGVRKQNFTYDSNGLGVWLKESAAFKDKAVPFNNKSAPSDSRLWNNLKSESAEKFVAAIKSGEMSISEEVLKRRFKDSKGGYFTLEDRLLSERGALKRKDDLQRFEIISKQQMKLEVGHSPDFIEGMFMIMPLFEKKKGFKRQGFENW